MIDFYKIKSGNHFLIAVPMLIASLYIGVIREGNAIFPNLIVYGICTLSVSFLLYSMFAFMLVKKHGLTSKDYYLLLLGGALFVQVFIAYFTRPEYLVWIFLCSVTALVAFLIKQLTPNRAFLCMFIAGLGLRVITNYHVPFGSASDMLPLVKSGLESFLNGENPYKSHLIKMPFGSYPLVLTYLPVTWLSYLPAYVLDLDLRWTNVAADIVSVFFFWHVARRHAASNGYLSSLLLCVWFVNPYFAYRTDAEISVFCMYLSVFLYALIARRFWLLGVVAGLLMAAMQLALIALPFVFLFMINNTGRVKAVLVSALALAVFVLFVLPFFSDNMVRGVLLHWQHLYAYDGGWAQTTIANLNYSTFFYFFNAQRDLVFVQALICFSMFFCCAWLRAYSSVSATLNFSAMTLFLFLQFNIIMWTYLLLPVLVLWCWCIVENSFEGNSAGRETRAFAFSG